MTMTLNEQLHNSAGHKPGLDPACPVCAKTLAAQKDTVNAQVHPVFQQALNSWASIGPGLYVRTANRKKKGGR